MDLTGADDGESPFQTLGTDFGRLFADLASEPVISLSVFATVWRRLDLSLLHLVSSIDQQLEALVAGGFFSPSRPLRDHQVLLLLLFFLHETQPSERRTSLRLCLFHVRLLFDVRQRAKSSSIPAQNGQSSAVQPPAANADADLVAVFDHLWQTGAITIIMSHVDHRHHGDCNEDVPQKSALRKRLARSHPSLEQMLERLQHIETLLHARPSLDTPPVDTTLLHIGDIFAQYSAVRRQERSDGVQRQPPSGGGIRISQAIAEIVKIIERHKQSNESLRTRSPSPTDDPSPFEARSRSNAPSRTHALTGSPRAASVPPGMSSSSAHRTRSLSSLRATTPPPSSSHASMEVGNMPQLDFLA